MITVQFSTFTKHFIFLKYIFHTCSNQRFKVCMCEGASITPSVQIKKSGIREVPQMSSGSTKIKPRPAKASTSFPRCHLCSKPIRDTRLEIHLGVLAQAISPPVPADRGRPRGDHSGEKRDSVYCRVTVTPCPSTRSTKVTRVDQVSAVTRSA